MLTIADASKCFGETQALSNVSLSVEAGELFVLIGLSGSGKSTLLNAVCGFEQLDEGRVSIGEKDVGNIRPYSREVELVFQNLGLFPHMSARKNIWLGAKKSSSANESSVIRAAQAARVPEKLLDSVVEQLSGGERQRVALARALSVQPKVLLLDEPLASLDALLRGELRGEIKAVHETLNCATIYVTHDKDDVFALADRVGFINEGRLEQVGTPEELYLQPQSLTAARLLGTLNVLSQPIEGIPAGSGFRPEHVRIHASKGKLRGTVAAFRYMGAFNEVICSVGGDSIVAHTSKQLVIGEEVWITFNPQHILCFD